MNSAPRVPVTVLAGLAPAQRAELLERWIGTRPGGECWAVLAEGGLALAALAGPGDGGEHAGLRIDPLGGCACCSGALVLRVTLARLLRQRRWQRVVLAVGAAARPAEILRLLREPSFAAAVEVREVVAAFDAGRPAAWFDPAAGLREAALAQLAEANLVLLVDAAAPAAAGVQSPANAPAASNLPAAADAPASAGAPADALRAALRALPGRRAPLGCRPDAWPAWPVVAAGVCGP